MCVAASDGHTEVVRVLVEAGAVLDLKASNECTALMYALYYKNNEAAALLVVRGAALEVQGHGGHPESNGLGSLAGDAMMQQWAGRWKPAARELN